MHLSINNKTGQPLEELAEHIKSLYEFSQKRLGFNRPPSINLLEDIENSKNVFGKTGYYDPNNMSIHIYTTGRHPKDILRSLSHELVHHSQNCGGQFDHPAVGETSLGYAQENGHLRKMESEAYLHGSGLIFRDWEDGIKSGTNYNESIKEKKNMSKINEQDLRKTIRSIIKTSLGEVHQATLDVEPEEGAEADAPSAMTILDVLQLAVKHDRVDLLNAPAEQALAQLKSLGFAPEGAAVVGKGEEGGTVVGTPPGHEPPDTSPWRRSAAAVAAAKDAAEEEDPPSAKLAEGNRKRVRQAASEANTKAAVEAAESAVRAVEEAKKKAVAKEAARKRAEAVAVKKAAAEGAAAEQENLTEWYDNSLYGRLLKEYTRN